MTAEHARSARLRSVGRVPGAPAVGVLRAAYEHGLRIPGDLSLVGYDNTTIASIAPINLTSVDQAGHDMGATAARLLRERMDGRSRSVVTFAAPRLIIRNTTGPPPGLTGSPGPPAARTR